MKNLEQKRAPVATTRRACAALRWLPLLVMPLLTALAWSAAGFASPAGAVNLVKQTTRRVLDAVERDRALIDEHPERVYALVEEFVLPYVDMRRISRLVLGRHWRRAPAPVRQRFVEAFQGLLIRTYGTAVTEYTQSTIDYLAPRTHRNNREVTVRTAIPQSSGPAVTMDYRMRRSEDGWKVVDVVIEGISLVATYRNSFGAQIREIGLEKLIERIKVKNREE